MKIIKALHREAMKHGDDVVAVCLLGATARWLETKDEDKLIGVLSALASVKVCQGGPTSLFWARSARPEIVNQLISGNKVSIDLD